MMSNENASLFNAPKAPRILAINPWIYDFAAYDFWGRPYGLLVLASMLRNLGARIKYFDCLHPPGFSASTKRYGCGPYEKKRLPAPIFFADVPRRFSRYGCEPGRLEYFLKNTPRPDCVLVTCAMTYWYPGVVAVIALLRRMLGDIPVILGGAYAALCTEHALKYSGADFVIAQSRPSAALDAVFAATNWRPRQVLDPDKLENWPKPALDLGPKPSFAPVLTSLGCPFDCAYCASRLLHPVLQRKSPGCVADEIAFWRKSYGVRDFVFYDDALLLDAEQHILPLLDKLLCMGLDDLRFHTPNAVHLRYLTPQVAGMMKKAGFRTLRLGLETTGERMGMDSKTSMEEFHWAAQNLLTAGFDNKNAGCYLLFGLPGQDISQAVHSIDQVAAAGLRPIPAYFSPIPGTRMWKAAQKASRYNLAAEPMCCNNSVFPCQKEAFRWQTLASIKSCVRRALR